ncbi:MAG: iron ABC transporter permease [Ilumatobacter sp.]|uniref:FecCD family ABC transporter permease n=1 Tax=Ilumatobacter sp. TaxID=1967498 RepID=UPI003C785C31
MTDAAADVAKRDRVWFVGGGILLIVSVLVGASIGPAGPDWWRVPLELLDRLPLVSLDSGVTDPQWNIVWKIRMPRVILGALVGGMLSIAGAGYQGVFRNPLVDPYLLGAASGAGLGATIAIVVRGGALNDWPVNPVPAIAFVFAVITVMTTYVVGAAFGGSRTGATLVLAGVAVVSFTSAMQTFVLRRNLDLINEVFEWILGSLAGATWGDVRLSAPYVVICSIVLILHRRHLDVFRVGDDEAATLGVSIGRTRLVIVVAATLGTAAVVSVSGLIGFVGLVVPHVVRLVAGSRNKRVLPLSLMGGASFLVLADVPGRILESPAETPIGVVTAFLGAPFFIYLLRTRRISG